MDTQSSSSRDHQSRGSRLQKEGEQTGATPGMPRIVIVDDEFFVAWHLHALLEDMGYAGSEVASNSRTAIGVAVELEANLLLMDVNLGKGPDGVETVRRILELRDTEVIFITAYTDEENLRRIRSVKPGALILAKPVSFEALKDAIGRLFPQD